MSLGASYTGRTIMFGWGETKGERLVFLSANAYLNLKRASESQACNKRACDSGWESLGYLWACSDAPPAAVLLAAAPLDDPFSAGGGIPHLPSDSSGSNTWTPPSDSPNANWFASCGWAAITSGCALELIAPQQNQACFSWTVHLKILFVKVYRF